MSKQNNYSDQEYIGKFLSIAGKDNCSKTEAGIKRAFGFGLKYKHSGASRIQRKAFEAIGYLKYQEIKKQISVKSDYANFIKRVKSLKTELDKTLEYSADQEIIKLVQHRSLPLSELSLSDDSRLFESISKDMQKLSLRLAILLDDRRSAKGKPSIEEFYAYIYEVACLFQELSQNEFRVYRHESHEPITSGHAFANLATHYLNSLARERNCSAGYSDKNILNACEAAKKRLNTNAGKL
jgi:hypothetical protein